MVCAHRRKAEEAEQERKASRDEWMEKPRRSTWPGAAERREGSWSPQKELARSSGAGFRHHDKLWFG